MKSIKGVLNEVKGEKAHKQAVEMGLKYKGFGYWVDPSTGEVAYKTENDTLVPVDPDVESEKAGKDGPEVAGGAPSGSFANPEGLGGSFGTFMNKQLPMGTGTNVLGTAENGYAQGPNPDNKRWDPGPDGDNMVYGQEEGELQKQRKVDLFVSKQNEYKWVAGPDGDNIVNVSFQDLIRKALNIDIQDEPEAVDFEMPDAATRPSMYEETEPGTRTAAQGILGLAPPANTEIAKGALGFNNLDTSGQGQVMRQMAAARKAGGGREQMGAIARNIPQVANRKQHLNAANEAIKHLVSDSEYDMGQTGEELGSGAFGTVYKSKDGKNVIKEGVISQGELLALHALGQNPSFPNLINAQLDEPFISRKDERERMGNWDGEDTLWGVADDSGTHFGAEVPQAYGKIAMQMMPGRPLRDAFLEMTDKQRTEAIQKLWKVRGAMHAAGIAHNDMHGGNIFVDDLGRPSVLDMGLAQLDPRAALFEGLGGISGYDSQLFSAAKGESHYSMVPDALKARVIENRGNIEQKIMDSLDMDPDDEEGWDTKMRMLSLIMDGGIRQRPRDLAAVTEHFPMLGDDNKVLDLIKTLYDNVENTDQTQRMSNAYDKLKDDRAAMARSIATRSPGGATPVRDKLLDALDPDD